MQVLTFPLSPLNETFLTASDKFLSIFLNQKILIMKKVSLIRSFLLFATVSAMVSCKKENLKQDLPNEDTFSVSAKLVIPESVNMFASAAGNSSNRDYNTFYGPAVQLGNGHLRSWVNITRTDNTPLALGIEFTAKALQNLPTDHANFAANTFVLPLHQKAKAATPFDHITINWEPEGHEPPGIYDVPHFDMHFYKITVAEQMAITGVPGPAPAAGYLPASYVIRAATVPQMGTHWLDPSSPELSPPFNFTHTFIYGSNNGNVHFWEPMITRAFLLSGTTVSKSIAQPLLFSPSNTNYPTEYKIWKSNENNRHYVALTDFVLR